MEGCGKHRYPGKGTAEKARKSLKGVGYDTRSLHTYYCKECAAWHVGHARATEKMR